MTRSAAGPLRSLHIYLGGPIPALWGVSLSAIRAPPVLTAYENASLLPSRLPKVVVSSYTATSDCATTLPIFGIFYLLLEKAI